MGDFPGYWPSGTNAVASSYHRAATVYPYDTFIPSNAIDLNETTKWNDGTQYEFPDALLIIPSTSLDLSGFVLVSAQDGWVTDFGVRVTDDLSMRNNMDAVPIIANVTGISDIRTTFTFNQTMPCALFQIDVFASSSGDYSRIHEVYPILAQAVASSSSSTSTTVPSTSASSTVASTTRASAAPPSSTSPPPSSSGGGGSTNTGAIAGGVVGGVAAILVVLLALYLIRRRKKKQQAAAPAELSGDEYRRELEHKPIHEMH